mmetsp:Transcript_14271/g.29530  ORF Transcript_14271/g.29530 Transcript_14271/m.29530 type:complete len:315 (+) Transcript_14271:175-1119(+)
MCIQLEKQQQQPQTMIKQQLPKTTKETKFSSSSSSSSVCSSSTTSTASLSPIHLGCGLDRSCPTSVTSLPSRVVRLDHYQIGAIRNRCLHVSSSDNRDDDFEWYDLDAIDENNASHTALRHNAQVGLVFTTERQRLRKQAKTNRFVDPLMVGKIHRQNNGPATLIISWIRGGNNNNNNNNNNNRAGYTQLEVPSGAAESAPLLQNGEERSWWPFSLETVSSTDEEDENAIHQSPLASAASALSSLTMNVFGQRRRRQALNEGNLTELTEPLVPSSSLEEEGTTAAAAAASPQQSIELFETSNGAVPIENTAAEI